MTFSCEVVGSTDAVATPESPADSQSDDGEITTSTNWKVFNIVFLAALVGMDSATKIQILASLKEKLEKGTLVVARSAWGVRGVLYPVRFPGISCSISEFLDFFDFFFFVIWG